MLCFYSQPPTHLSVKVQKQQTTLKRARMTVRSEVGRPKKTTHRKAISSCRQWQRVNYIWGHNELYLAGMEQHRQFHKSVAHKECCW